MPRLQLAVRYFSTQFGVSTDWPVAYASQMCSIYPSGVSVTGSPSHGDLAVFSWAPYGHVAIISGVNGDGSINVWEQVGAKASGIRRCKTRAARPPFLPQNSSPTGTNTYPAGEAACYLTAGGTPSQCPAMDGLYCGDDGLGLSRA